MKRPLAVILALVCAVGLAGCGDKSSGPAGGANTPPQIPEGSHAEDVAFNTMQDAEDPTLHTTWDEDEITCIWPPDLTMLTLKSLVEICGEDLTWIDLAPYYCDEVGSGLYILRYPIGWDYSLLVGGESMKQPPLYILLVSELDPDSYIEVRTDSMDDFLDRAPKLIDFSYEEELKLYQEGNPGVKCGDFLNTAGAYMERICDAVELAKAECTIQYDTVDVYYDRAAYIWKVVFYTANMAGGDQAVYMDCNGVTRLIVYGE